MAYLEGKLKGHYYLFEFQQATFHLKYLVLNSQYNNCNNNGHSRMLLLYLSFLCHRQVI